MRRVAITGVGLVSPYGCDVRGFWRAIAEGRSAVRSIDDLPGAESGIRVGAPVTGFVVRDYIDAKALRLMAPAVAFGVAAADLAMTDAGLVPGHVAPERLGAFIGSRGHSSDRGDLMTAIRAATGEHGFELSLFGTRGLPLVHPMWLLKGLANNVLYFVSLKHNAQGMNNNLSEGGAAATIAIGEAFDAIRRGAVDVAIAGGYDSVLDQDRLEMFAPSRLATKATDPAGASRPFDRRRDGFVPGEGAAMLVLEPLEEARTRGARIYGEVTGYGAATAPRSPVDLEPSADGFAAALEAALAGRGRPDAVFAHGLATASSDAEETIAMRRVFGSDAPGVPLPAVKSMIGNTFAASGALEAVAALGALAQGWLPPTINLTDPDPACDLDYVAGSAARQVPVRTVALNNANLGGAHAAIVLGRVE